MKTNKGLFYIFGLPFREGGQGSPIYGTPNSFNQQMQACYSHIKLIEHYLNTNICDEISVFVNSTTTQYDKNIDEVYDKYLIQSKFGPFNNRFLGETLNFTPQLLPNLTDYDFILSIRIDLYLEDIFLNEFKPNLYKETIHFFSLCWYHDSVTKINNIAHPRVNPVIFIVPKKYYQYMDHYMFHHEAWFNLIERSKLTLEDIDVMTCNYYDSDSQKDYNPYYYIVNRIRNYHWYSTEIPLFNKYIFYNI